MMLDRAGPRAANLVGADIVDWALRSGLLQGGRTWAARDHTLIDFPFPTYSGGCG